MGSGAGAQQSAHRVGELEQISSYTAQHETTRGERRITLRVQDSTIAYVVQEIVRQGQRRISYSDNLPELSKRIRVQVSNVSAMDAMTVALKGTHLRANLAPDGETLVIQRTEVRSAQAGQKTTGVIQGRIVDSLSGKGVPGATVTVQGMKLSAASTDQGTFTLQEVPEGKQNVIVRAFGYKSGSRTVSVESGKTVTMLASLVPVSVTLNEVVTTATGDQKRMEVGNAVATINADSIVSRLPVNNLSDLLAARVPGVVVSPSSGLVGAPSKIRMRGINSPVLNNDPIIILDGVRLQSQVTLATVQSNLGAVQPVRTGVSGVYANTPSRIDDIDPSTIESIDILRGPSASSLYGTEASNGVIVIKTKRGRPGPLQRSLGMSHSISNPTLPFRRMFGLGHSASPYPMSGCSVIWAGVYGHNVADGICELDTVMSFSPQHDPEMRTLSDGSRTRISGDISGGSESLRQFLSLSLANSIGPIKMSSIEERRLTRQWGSKPPAWLRRPNQAKEAGVTSSIDFMATPKLTTTLVFTGSYNDTRSGGTGLEGESSPYQQSQNGLYTPLSRADSLLYFSAEVMRGQMENTAKRGTASVSAQYRPMSWLNLNGNLGGDYGTTSTDALLRDRDCTLLTKSQCAPSMRETNKRETLGVTFNVGASGTLNVGGWFQARTTIGEQYNKNRSAGIVVGNRGGTRLAFGTDLLTPSPIPDQPGVQLFSVEEARDEAITAGWYIDQQISMLHQLFLGMGFRRDIASAFGSSLRNNVPSYPKYTASWVVPDNLFSHAPWVTSVRLRTAFGHAGQQARQEDVLNQFAGNQWIANGSAVKGLVVTSIGNADLRPERGTELEYGFDLSLFSNGRVEVDATMFRKRIKDQIDVTTLPQSYGLTSEYGGSGNFRQLRNFGSVLTRGYEISLRTRPVSLRSIDWSVSTNLSRTNQKIVSLIDGAQIGSDRRHRVGYPLFSYFGNKVISYADLDGNGYLSLPEVTFSKQAAYLGSSYPRATLTYSSSLVLASGVIGLSTDVEHVIGSTTRLASPGLFDPSASLARQAAEVEAQALGGYFREADYLRLRNVAVTWKPPVKVVRFLRARSLAVSLSGTNLGLWTNYVGKDPSVESPAGNGIGERYAVGDEGTGVLQPREWYVRISLGF